MNRIIDPRKVFGYIGGIGCLGTALIFTATGQYAQTRTTRNFCYLGAASAAIFGGYLLHMACADSSSDDDDEQINTVAFRRRASITVEANNNEEDDSNSDDKDEKIGWESYVKEMYAANGDSEITPTDTKLPEADERLI